MTIVFALIPIVLAGCDNSPETQDGAPELAWHLERLQPALLPATPAIVDGSVIIPTGSELRRVDLSSGDVLWSAPMPGVSELRGRLHADDKAVYAWHVGESIRAYTVEDGELLWEASLQNAPTGFFTDLLDAGDFLIIPVADSIVKVDKTTGLISTVIGLSDELTGGLSQRSNYLSLDREDRLCIPTDFPFPGSEYPGVARQGIVYGVDLNSGVVNWAHELELVERNGVEFEQPAHACVSDGVVNAIVTGDQVVALEASTGDLAWTQDALPLEGSTDAFAPGPASTDGTRLFVGSVGGYLYALNIASGDVEWSAKAPGSYSNNLPVVQSDAVYVVNAGSGELWILGGIDGRVRARLLPPSELDDGFLSRPVVEGEYIVALGYRNVYAYRL